MPTHDDDIEQDSGTRTSTSSGILEKAEKPRMFRVFILNDHYTPMDFVIEVLISIFNKFNR